MVWNETLYRNRQAEIYHVCCGYTSEYLFEILTEYARIQGISRPAVLACDISRSKLIDLVFRMVAITQVSNDEGSEYWIVPGGSYLVDLND